MSKITNIKLKFGRAETILMVKKLLSCSLTDAKIFVDKTLDYGFINLNELDLAPEYLLGLFDGKYVEDPDTIGNYFIRKPDEKTSEALAWFETLSEIEKEKINLIKDWYSSGFVAVG